MCVSSLGHTDLRLCPAQRPLGALMLPSLPVSVLTSAENPSLLVFFFLILSPPIKPSSPVTFLVAVFSKGAAEIAPVSHLDEAAARVFLPNRRRGRLGFGFI